MDLRPPCLATAIDSLSLEITLPNKSIATVTLAKQLCQHSDTQKGTKEMINILEYRIFES